MADLPPEARSFIERCIDSVDALEILLLLQREPTRQWTSSSVASETRTSVTKADRHLARLVALSLVDVKIGSDLFYWYSPRLPHLERGARAAATAWAAQREDVVQFVRHRKAEPLRDFAEAFRLTKKDDSDG